MRPIDIVLVVPDTNVGNMKDISETFLQRDKSRGKKR